ncbi:MAG: OmpA family protein [Planctomycetota bacterium]
MTTIKTSTRATLPLTASLLLLSSCVSQQRYDEALQEARYYQRMYQDLEPVNGELEAENALLRGQLDLYEREQPIEAVFTADIDKRLEDLQRIASGLGNAPGDVTVLQVQGGYGFRLADAVLFSSGSSEVTPEGQSVLTELAQDISSRPFERLWVRGHTDSDPIVKETTRRLFPTNLHLSAARALGVATALVADGIAPGKVAIAGFGPNEPVASNTSADGKRQNRRVELFVIEDEAEAEAEGR